jgi:hypothetical protein
VDYPSNPFVLVNPLIFLKFPRLAHNKPVSTIILPQKWRVDSCSLKINHPKIKAIMGVMKAINESITIFTLFKSQ